VQEIVCVDKLRERRVEDLLVGFGKDDNRETKVCANGEGRKRKKRFVTS